MTKRKDASGRIRASRARLVPVPVLIALCIGCTFVWVPTAPLRLPEEGGKIPLRVGVYIPETVQSLVVETKTDNVRSPERNKLMVGRASAELFRQGFPHVFEEVQLLSKGSQDDRYHFVLTPTIAESSMEVTREAGGGARLARIEYAVDILDRDGTRSTIRSGTATGAHRVYSLRRYLLLPLYLAGQILTLGGYDQTAVDFMDAFAQAQAGAFRRLVAELRAAPAIVQAVEGVSREQELARAAPQAPNLDEQIHALTAQLVQGLGLAPPRRIALAGFTPVPGPPTQFQAYLSEELVTRLSAAKPHTVVERSLLDKAMAELHLNQTDLVDPKQAKALGKLTGADAVLVGSTTEMGRQVRVSARIVETETGSVLAVSTVTIFQHESVRQLLNRKIETGLR